MINVSFHFNSTNILVNLNADIEFHHYYYSGFVEHIVSHTALYLSYNEPSESQLSKWHSLFIVG